MIATKEKGASLVEASSGERPFSQKVSDRDDMGSDIRHGDESCTIDPDLVLFKEMTESMTKWRTGASEQDPDISADPPEQDPDILANLPERIERKNDELVNGIMPSLPLRRLRKKTTPSAMHIEQNNNITVAYATPLTAKTNKTSIIPQRNAILTRGDLLSTSKYYKYHKAMGHTPQHIQHVAGRQRKRLLAESGLPTHMHKQIYLIQDTSIMNNKKATHANNQNPDMSTPPKNTHLMDAHH